MSKISEQKALEAYPDVTLEECHGDTKIMNYCNNDNSSLREGYIEGYDQAFKDFMEKACEWLKHAEGYIVTSEGGDSEIDNTFIKDFKNYMQDESN